VVSEYRSTKQKRERKRYSAKDMKREATQAERGKKKKHTKGSKMNDNNEGKTQLHDCTSLAPALPSEVMGLPFPKGARSIEPIQLIDSGKTLSIRAEF